jgi:hypothetical protein
MLSSELEGYRDLALCSDENTQFDLLLTSELGHEFLVNQLQVMEVTEIPFNVERYGGDPVGNIWWIATHVKDVSLEETAQRVEAAGWKWQPPP